MPRQSNKGTSTGQTKESKRKLPIDHTLLNKVPGPSREKISKKFNDPEFVQMEDESSDESSLESEDSEDIESLKGENVSKARRKHTWLPQEDRAIKDFFKEDINEFSKSGNQGSLHGVTKKIHTFISKNPDVLKEYPDKVKVHKIRTKVINLRRQSRKKYEENMGTLTR
ncbi:uncharacterized protein LOC133199834 [Saccostrea echinata]|uniref:uncharacterized protein LOC133199834 n=1 Tax=Saccostrea echinata TaxID=191078 RepID=UPI002A82CC5A|nr:uncharacterized protein LOC133199834 [Saccostrea echinata]